MRLDFIRYWMVTQHFKIHFLFVIKKLIHLFLPGDKSDAEAAAQKTRSLYPIDYQKNRPVKVRLITEAIDLTSESDKQR